MKMHRGILHSTTAKLFPSYQVQQTRTYFITISLYLRCGNGPSNKLIIWSVCVVTQLSSVSHFSKFLCVFNFLCKIENKMILNNANRNNKCNTKCKTENKNANRNINM